MNISKINSVSFGNIYPVVIYGDTKDVSKFEDKLCNNYRGPIGLVDVTESLEKRVRTAEGSPATYAYVLTDEDWKSYIFGKNTNMLFPPAKYEEFIYNNTGNDIPEIEKGSEEDPIEALNILDVITRC